MFEKQQLIGNRFVLPQLHELLLQPHAVLVRDELKVAKLTNAHNGCEYAAASRGIPAVMWMKRWRLAACVLCR
jgi:hypothetical protein